MQKGGPLAPPPFGPVAAVPKDSVAAMWWQSYAPRPPAARGSGQAGASRVLGVSLIGRCTMAENAPIPTPIHHTMS
jgi:hypothetical protein